MAANKTTSDWKFEISKERSRTNKSCTENNQWDVLHREKPSDFLAGQWLKEPVQISHRPPNATELRSINELIEADCHISCKRVKFWQASNSRPALTSSI